MFLNIVLTNDRIIFTNELKLIHNLKGPAIITFSGLKQYWINGTFFKSKEKWEQSIKDNIVFDTMWGNKDIY